jgi:two-component system nitrate/nitrite response regulator NarL
MPVMTIDTNDSDCRAPECQEEAGLDPIAQRSETPISLAKLDHPLCVLILSSIVFLREALTEVLGRDDDFRVAGGGDDEVFTAILANPPHVLLIDTNLPDGLRTVGRLRPLAPDTLFVALAVADNEAEVLNWAKAGICGYIPREAALGDLPAHIKAIVRGEQRCSYQVASGLLRWIASGSQPTTRPPDPWDRVLTAREQQVARLLATGFSNKEIARRLDVSLGTTKSHVHSVLGKLHLTHRNEVSRLMRAATSRGDRSDNAWPTTR